MNLKYVGNKAFRTRMGEFSYKEREEERAFKIFDYLRKQGWNVDSGVFEWAGVDVADKTEFENLMEDFKEAKRLIK